jgi:hypothetical protein
MAKGKDCCGLAAQTYRFFVPLLGTESSELYTVCLVQDDEGTCLATCREVPGVLVFGQSEGGALAAEQAAVEEALAGRSSCAEVGQLASRSARCRSAGPHPPIP